MGNFIDRQMFPITSPLNLNEAVDFISNSPIQYVEIKNDKSDNVILYSHGNNCTLDDIYDFLRSLSEKTGYSIVAYEYPDEATEQKVNAWIQMVHEFMCETYDSTRIILMGRSIGSGPTFWLANLLQERVRFVVVVSPFTSICRYIASQGYFGIGYCFSKFVDERFDNAKVVATLKCSLLFIHGKDDEIISHWDSNELYLRHAVQVDFSRQLQIIDNLDHDTICNPTILAEKIVAFDLQTKNKK